MESCRWLVLSKGSSIPIVLFQGVWPHHEVHNKYIVNAIMLVQEL